MSLFAGALVKVYRKRKSVHPLGTEMGLGAACRQQGLPLSHREQRPALRTPAQGGVAKIHCPGSSSKEIKGLVGLGPCVGYSRVGAASKRRKEGT